MNRFEKTGLAAPVRTNDEIQPRRELGLDIGKDPKAADFEGGNMHDRQRPAPLDTEGRLPDTGEPYSRIGITTN